jgi:hypothetical protein
MTRKYSSISVETTLASGISNSATTMTVAAGTGSALMGGVTLAAGNVDQFTVALDVDTQNEEVVFITAVSSDTFTIVRGRAGTSAISHSGGATVKHVLTSDDLNFYTTGVATADAAVPESIVTAKADLLVASASGVVDNLAVGTNNQVLTADSAATLGIKWATPASGDVTLTGTQTLTNKTIDAASNTLTGVVTLTGTQTLTNKTIDAASNTLTGVVTLTGTQTLTNKTLTDAKIDLAFDAETASYTAVLANSSQIVTMNNASANIFSIPTNASVAFPIGTQINVLQIGAGQTTIQAVTSGTTTIQSNATTSAAPALRARYSAATCIKAGTDLWYVIGDIS